MHSCNVKNPPVRGEIVHADIKHFNGNLIHKIYLSRKKNKFEFLGLMWMETIIQNILNKDYWWDIRFALQIN